MEQKRVTVDTMLLMEQYKELLRTVKTLPLLVTGNSMAPFLVDRRDTVYLSGIRRPLRRGDIVLAAHTFCTASAGEKAIHLPWSATRRRSWSVASAASRSSPW